MGGWAAGQLVWLVPVATLVSAAAIAVLVVWLCCDGYMAFVRPLIGTTLDAAGPTDESLQVRTLGANLLTLAFWGAWSVVLLGVLVGSRHQRSLRRIFWLTSMVALWLIAQVQWPAIVESGRTIRHRLQCVWFQEFASRVDKQWEAIVRGDDALLTSQLNAYPLAAPTLLMFAGDQSIPRSSDTFCAIERTDDHAIRFELTRSNRGYWLEVRPDQTRPTDFKGGLDEHYALVDAKPIGERVFLVRYSVR